MDHVVAEVWDQEEERWRLVETELERKIDSVDYLDLTEEQFITGPSGLATGSRGQGRSGTIRRVASVGSANFAGVAVLGA